MCLVFGYFAEKSAITAFVEGLMIVEDKIRMAPPFAAIAVSLSAISLSTLDQVAAAPLAVGPVKRDESYNESTEA